MIHAEKPATTAHGVFRVGIVVKPSSPSVKEGVPAFRYQNARGDSDSIRTDGLFPRRSEQPAPQHFNVGAVKNTRIVVAGRALGPADAERSPLFQSGGLHPRESGEGRTGGVVSPGAVFYATSG